MIHGASLLFGIPRRLTDLIDNVVVDEQNFIIRLLGFTPRRSLVFNFTRELYNRYS